MSWDTDTKNNVINTAMDLAANVDRFRQVLVLTVDLDGNFGVAYDSHPSSTVYEMIGILGMYIGILEDLATTGIKESDRPLNGDSE